MKTSRKLIALSLALNALGSTCAFARATLHFENSRVSKNYTIKDYAPIARRSSTTSYADGPPSIYRSEGDWPTNMPTMHQE